MMRKEFSKMDELEEQVSEKKSETNGYEKFLAAMCIKNFLGY